MITLNLIVTDKEKIDHVVNSILRNQFALNVIVGDAMDSYHLSSSGEKILSVVYTIQFVTKSLLFNQIERSLKKEFEGMDFYIYAAPAVHINTDYYEKIKIGVVGLNLIEEQAEH